MKTDQKMYSTSNPEHLRYSKRISCLLKLKKLLLS